MKLAEALQERADLNIKINQLSDRIENNALVVDGEAPVEDPVALMQELNECLDRLEYIIRQINYTNCKTILDGYSLTDLIAQRDVLKQKRSLYKDIYYAGSQSTNRTRNSEIKIVSTIDVVSIQKQIDEISKEIRRVDNIIQAANWAIDLCE